MSTVATSTMSTIATKKPKSAFAFPQAPVDMEGKAASIIDISNVSSEASVSSDVSQASSLYSALTSPDYTNEVTENLDTAIL